MTIGTKTAASTRAMSDSAARKTGVKKDVEKAAAAASQEVRIAKIVKSAAKQSTAVKAERLQVPKCRRSNMTQSKGRHKCKNSSDTKTAVKAERSCSLETAQAVTEKAEETKATEEKSVSSVAETVPKHVKLRYIAMRTSVR